MPAISQHVPTVMLDALPRYDFHIDAHNQLCTHFTNRFRNYIVALCKYYEDDIEAELKRPDCGKTREDLNTWAISELLGILFAALGSYRIRVVDAETLKSDEKIRCELALTYFAWLIDLTESIRRQRNDARKAPPSSPKFRRKRDQRRWTPYGFEIAFDLLKKLFGGK